MPAIIEKRNLIQSQRRYVLVLACKHFVSIPERDLIAHPQLLETLRTATTWPCVGCPEPVIAPSVRQLWKDAGEP